MAITFLSNLISDLYILWYRKNRNYIIVAICYTATIIWYLTSFFIHRAQTPHIDMVIPNILLMYITTECIRYLMLHDHIKLSEDQTTIFAFSLSFLFCGNMIPIPIYMHKQHIQHYTPSIQHIIIANNIIFTITNTGMIGIITYTLYKHMHKILIDTRTTLSHHATIQKIKKFPKFTQQRALIYYTEK